jgi:hypothetical protein
LGQGYALLSSLTDGVDSTLGMLCDELERDRVGMAILANPTTPHVDPAWMAEVRKRADSSATKLPQVASLLCQLEPQGKELRKLCIELIERAPRLPLPILAAAKTAAAALDRWLEHGPLTEEVARLHRELQDVGSISEMVGARAIAKQIKAAAQALGE